MIQPDTKNWTWVITDPCPDCGLDAAKVSYDDIPGRIRANAASWVDVLQRPDVANRPRPDVWSPLEYACHVRDVFTLFDQRLERMLTEDDPLFDNWDQDAMRSRTGTTSRTRPRSPRRSRPPPSASRRASPR